MNPVSALSVSLAPSAFSFHWPFHSGHKHFQAFEKKKSVSFQPTPWPHLGLVAPALTSASQGSIPPLTSMGMPDHQGNPRKGLHHCFMCPSPSLQSTLTWPWPWLSTLLFGPKGHISLATTPCTLPVSPRPAWPLSSLPPPNGDSSVSLPGPCPFSLLTHTLGFSSHL